MNPSHQDFRELSEITEEHLNFRALDSGLGFGANSLLKNSQNKPMATSYAFSQPANSQPSPSPVTLPAVEISVRLSAFFTDLFIALAPWGAVLLWASRSTKTNLFAQTDTLLFAGLFLVVYFLLTESLGGQSIGKMLFSLRTVEDDKYEKPVGFRSTLIRIIGLAAGSLFFGLGLFLAFIDHKRRPWHDKLSGSIVRRKLY
jgi:uncharacterized RDD family membrane protein YckC